MDQVVARMHVIKLDGTTEDIEGVYLPRSTRPRKREMDRRDVWALGVGLFLGLLVLGIVIIGVFGAIL